MHEDQYGPRVAGHRSRRNADRGPHRARMGQVPCLPSGFVLIVSGVGVEEYVLPMDDVEEEG